MQERMVGDSQRSYARLAGLMYLVVLLLDIAGSVIVSSVGGTGTCWVAPCPPSCLASAFTQPSSPWTGT
jgi:hypothetical protein